MLLKFLRKKKNMKRIVWALAILIIPAFVLWGTGTSGKKNKGPKYAGKIFKHNVSFSEYTNMRMVVKDHLTRSFGANFPAGAIDQMTWNRLILLDAAKKEHIAVNDTEVVDNIASFPIFQKEGLFDKKLYKSMLGDSARGFEERLRDDIRMSKLREKVTQDISITEDELKEEYKKKFEKIKATYVSVPFSDFEKDIRYKENNLISHYENNEEVFRKPEHINVNYIGVLFDSFDNEIYVTEEEVKKYFEEHVLDFKKPDSEEIPELNNEIKKEVSGKLSRKKKVSLAEELAYKVLDETLDKKELDKTASSFTLEAKETGFFNEQQEIPGIGWSYELTKKGFELKPGEISNILIKTDLGFYIIQLKEKNASYIPLFAEVKDAVIKSYKKEKAIDLSQKKAKKITLNIKNKIKNSTSYKDAVINLGLEIKETDLVTRDGYISGVGSAKELVEAAVRLQPLEITSPVKTLTSWVIVKLDEYQAIDEVKFIKEKDEFKENLLSKKKQAAFDNWFEALKKKANFVSYTSPE